jgi:hypothetical protein
MNRVLVFSALSLAIAACSEDPNESLPDAAGLADAASPNDATPSDATSPADAGTFPDASSLDGGRPDVGSRDASTPTDAGPIVCPSANEYVGDPNWEMTLTAGADSRLCAFPSRFGDAKAAISEKHVLRIVEGSYQIPTSAKDLSLFIPACFESPGSPSIAQGTVNASRGEDLLDNVDRYLIDASFPLSDGGTLFLGFRSELAAPDLDLSVPVQRYGAIGASRCATAQCDSPDDIVYTPCKMIPRICDRHTFTDGEIAIEQYHWAGSVGAGFAMPLRVFGTFRGSAFDIDAYEQMTLGYGHHAFQRELYFFFDVPLDGVCGLHIAEVSEYGTPSDVELIDCDANPIGTSATTAREHLYNGACVE